MLEETTERAYTTALLTAETWEDFVALVEANNGVWGGCWCMGFHPEGLDRTSARHNRENKHAHVRQGTVHQVLVYDGKDCVGWCQYGTPAELPTINNAKAYDKELIELPDWRIGCIFTGKGHRRNGGRQSRLERCSVGDRGGRWRTRRGLPRTGRGPGAATRLLLPHRPGEPVRGTRVHPRP